MDIKVGLIGGTGLGEALGGEVGTRHEIDETPFGKPSDAIIETTWEGMPVFVLSRHGPGHLFNPSCVPYRANIFALKQLGVTHILASGAVGSLREELRPRDLVIPDQVIDRTTKRPRTFFDNEAVHVEFAEPFCPVLRRILIESATAEVRASTEQTSKELFKVHDRGCYVCMEGPAFSTRAESLMHRLWGGDLIGMTVLPEAKLAREAEISYALIALVTDYDCWRNKPPSAAEGKEEKPAVDRFTLLQEILGNVKAASENAISLMRSAVRKMSERKAELETSPALKALELAIWSDKSRIAPDEVQRLAPLWMKYFT